MSTPSIKVGQGNWGIKTAKLLGYANTEKRFSPVEFTSTRSLNTATRVNASGNIQAVNADIPRIDYFGGQASLLVEPSATNSIRNNSMVNAVAGTPGALPTNWAEFTQAGLSREIVATGTESGIPYIDYRIFGNANSNATRFLAFESTTQIVASSGQRWTNSVYAKVVSAPNPPSQYSLYIVERNAGGGSIISQVANISIGSSLTRFELNSAPLGATTERVQPTIAFLVSNAQSYDFTIRIGYPQMELSSVATSVIPTTTGTVTRNADVISVTGVAGLIGQTEGTIYAEVDLSRITTNAILSLNDGTGTNRFIIQFFSSTVLLADIRVAGVNANYSVTIPAIPANGGIYKVALGYKANDYCFALNGTTYASTASRGVPATTQINLGNYLSSNQFNDRIRAVSIYQTRLPNTTTDGSLSLQSITTL